MDPEVLSALPDDLQQEILQTLPQKRNRLMVEEPSEVQNETGPSLTTNTPSCQSKRPNSITCILLVEGQDASLEDLLAANHCDRIPLKLEQLLHEMLDNKVRFGELDPSMVQKVFDLLFKWIEDHGQEEMETLVSVLKVVRRIGLWYPVLFQDCSEQFIDSVQNSFHQKNGFWLKLRTHL